MNPPTEDAAAEFREDLTEYVEPIPPDLIVPGPNEPLPVFEGPATVDRGESRIAGSALVEIRWSPTPALLCRFEASADGDLGRLLGGDNPLRLNVQGSTGVVRVRGGVARKFDDALPWLAARLYDVMWVDYGPSATQLRFEIVNLESYHGEPIKYGTYSWRAGRLNLLSERWSIEIDDLAGLIDIERTLDDVGGYAVTHLARASKRDGSVISRDEAEALLTAVQMSLSIASGRWITPVRPRGFSSDGSLAWEAWGLWNTAPWSKPITWAGHMAAQDLALVFRAVDDRWQDPYWERLIRTATHYFLEASEGLVHKQLILGIALLELVGWHVVVEDRGLMSAAGYDRLDTADKVRLVLRLLNADVEIPTGLHVLREHCTRSGWPDGPKAVAEARHIAVHAKRHRSGWEWDVDVWSDVTQLCEAYCDLAILGLLDYQGRYVDRITARYAADARPVPWAT